LTEKQEKPPDQNDEITRLKKENQDLKNRILGFEMQRKLHEKKSHHKKEEDTTPEEPPQQPQAKEEPKAPPHYVAPFERFCPYCTDQHEENPDFKPEEKHAVCSDCGAPLGPLSSIWEPVKNPEGKLKRCYNCGGTKARIRD
jgi:hypothetical protein